MELAALRVKASRHPAPSLAKHESKEEDLAAAFAETTGWVDGT